MAEIIKKNFKSNENSSQKKNHTDQKSSHDDASLKKSRREKIRIAEMELKILRRDRVKTRAMIISTLQIATDLLKKGENPPLIVGKAVIKKGHKDATVHDLFEELANYSPKLMKPHNEFEDGKLGYLTESLYDVLHHDIKFWNELNELCAINDSERTDIQKLSELLEKLDGLSGRIVRI